LHRLQGTQNPCSGSWFPQPFHQRVGTYAAQGKTAIQFRYPRTQHRHFPKILRLLTGSKSGNLGGKLLNHTDPGISVISDHGSTPVSTASNAPPHSHTTVQTFRRQGPHRGVTHRTFREATAPSEACWRVDTEPVCTVDRCNRRRTPAPVVLIECDPIRRKTRNRSFPGRVRGPRR